MVTADGEAVAVATDLPHIEVGVSDFGAGGDGGGTTVDGVHAVGGHVVRQTAAAADTTDDGDVLGCYAYLGECLVQGGEEEMISAARTPPRLPFLIIFTFHTMIVYRPQMMVFFFHHELHELHEFYRCRSEARAHRS